MNTYFTQDNIMKRFFFVTGKTKDTFVNEAMEAVDIEYMIYDHLQKLGYERIVFYSKTQKLYCYDETSFRLVVNPNLKIENVKKPSLINGPMGGGMLSALNQPEKSEDTEENGILNFSRMNDMDAFMRIDGCMQDDKHKTAVIFTNAEDFFAFFGTVRTDRGSESIQSKIYDSINNYDGLGYGNENIMIFIFPQRSLSETMEIYKNQGGLWMTQFSPRMSKGQGVIDIGAPAKSEIRNAINYIRIKHGLKVCVREIDKISELFAKTMFANKESLSTLMHRFSLMAQNGTELNYETTEAMCGKSKAQTALSRLNELIGMKSVKNQINAFVKRAEANKIVKISTYIPRIEPQPVMMTSGVNMNFVLTGNPGTGKTTVAKLLGEILYDLGFLPSGHTVKVTRNDLVAGYVGQTAIKTANCIESAMGGMLFVDEAYMLKNNNNERGSDNDFGQEAIDTILEAMSDRMGRFGVIAAGYPKEMEGFLNSNPGLARRFNKIIHIEDYEPDELIQIFYLNCAKRQYVCDEKLSKMLSPFMENWFRSRDENWGNAGNVEKLLDTMFEHWCTREGNKNESGMPILSIEDIPENLQIHLKSITDAKKDAIEALDKLVGLERVKNRINELKLFIQFEGKSAPGHYIFAGNPGTGKTTVARLLGDLFCEVGVLRRGHVVEVNREDLVSEHVGGTAKKTKRVVEKALDGVLFIDEAYRLYETSKEGNWGKEAIDTLVALMENYRDRLCVICAGYSRPMLEFMQSNPGLKSRFAEIIEFEDYSADEMLQILRVFADKDGKMLSDDFELKCSAIFEFWTMRKTPDFGNGRDVRKFFDQCKITMFKRLAKEYGSADKVPEDVINTLTGDDIPEEYNKRFEKVEEEPFEKISKTILPLSIESKDIDSIAKGLLLFVIKKGTGIGFGSGFLISDSGYAITCNHVIDSADEIKARVRIPGRIGGIDSLHNVKVLKADKRLDIALVKLDGDNFPTMKMSENIEIKRGDDVTLLGYPFGAKLSDDFSKLDYSMFEGRIASIQQQKGVDTVFVDMEAKRGNSGGPVINSDTGEVVGVLCGSQMEGDSRLVEEINYIRPVKYVFEEFINTEE